MIKEYHRVGTECQPHSVVFFDYCGPKSEGLQSWGDIALSLVVIWLVICGNHLFTELPAEFSIDMLSGWIYRGDRIILNDIAHIVEELPLFPLPRRQEMPTILKKRIRNRFQKHLATHTTGVMQKRASKIVGDFMIDIFGEDSTLAASRRKTQHPSHQ